MATTNNFIKAQTNIPIVGKVKFADFRESRDPGKFGDQVSLKGNFQGHPDNAMIYLPITAVEKLQNIGFLGEREADNKYRVLMPNAVLTIKKTEGEGGRTSFVFSTDSSAPSAPPATGGQGTASRPPTSNGSFEGIVDHMRCCYVAAKKLLADLLFEEPAASVVQTAAHSLFIESNRRGITVSAPRTKGLCNETTKLRVAQLAVDAGLDNTWMRNKLSTFGFTSIDDLTEFGAERLVNEILAVQKQTADIPF